MAIKNKLTIGDVTGMGDNALIDNQQYQQVNQSKLQQKSNQQQNLQSFTDYANNLRAQRMQDAAMNATLQGAGLTTGGVAYQAQTQAQQSGQALASTQAQYQQAANQSANQLLALNTESQQIQNTQREQTATEQAQLASNQASQDHASKKTAVSLGLGLGTIAIGALLAPFTGGMSALAAAGIEAGVGATLGVTSSVATDAIMGDDIDGKDAAVAGALGAVTGGFSGAFGAGAKGVANGIEGSLAIKDASDAGRAALSENIGKDISGVMNPTGNIKDVATTKSALLDLRKAGATSVDSEGNFLDKDGKVIENLGKVADHKGLNNAKDVTMNTIKETLKQKYPNISEEVRNHLMTSIEESYSKHSTAFLNDALTANHLSYPKLIGQHAENMGQDINSAIKTANETVINQAKTVAQTTAEGRSILGKAKSGWKNMINPMSNQKQVATYNALLNRANASGVKASIGANARLMGQGANRAIIPGLVGGLGNTFISGTYQSETQNATQQYWENQLNLMGATSAAQRVKW